MQKTGKEVACVRFTLNVLCYSTVAQPRYQGQSNNGPWRPIWSLSMCDLIELNEATGARYSYLLWGGVGGGHGGLGWDIGCNLLFHCSLVKVSYIHFHICRYSQTDQFTLMHFRIFPSMLLTFLSVTDWTHPTGNDPRTAYICMSILL